jgi:heptosyltransferase-1
VIVTPSIQELVALTALARVVVAADTGPLHVASAAGTRVVALFGPTDPARNGPIPSGTVLRKGSNEAATYKREGNYSPTMLAIGVEDVAEAVEREWRTSG